MVLASATQEFMYLVQLLKSTHRCLYTLPKVYGENQGTIKLEKSSVCRQRYKYLDINYHFVRSVVNNGEISLEYGPTDCNKV